MLNDERLTDYLQDYANQYHNGDTDAALVAIVAEHRDRWTHAFQTEDTEHADSND